MLRSWPELNRLHAQWQCDILTIWPQDQKNQYIIRFTDNPNLVDFIGEERFVTINYYGIG